jgi:hypothetical protein
MAQPSGDLQGAWPGREPVIRNDPLDPERDGIAADGGAGRGGLAGRPLLRHSREGGNPALLSIECTVTVMTCHRNDRNEAP